MKTCKFCGIKKDKMEFYSSKISKDGLQSYCKTCTINKTVINRRKRKLIPEVRLKYYLYEKNRNRAIIRTPELYEKYFSYRQLFPEKIKAKKVSQKIEIKEGYIKHHWSYNEEHWMDIIYMTQQEHMLVHSKIIYDQERMMYRKLDGILLNTKKEHLAYISTIFN